MKRHKDVPEIPKVRQFANQPELDKIFTERILMDECRLDGKIA